MTEYVSDLEEFQPFPKIARLSRNCVITEKIDGTNAQVVVLEDGRVLAASRNRYLRDGESDNFGFGAWVRANAGELMALGPGRHFGEWWGSGIQRGYGLLNGEKRFSLFNTHRWSVERPACCGVVPVLYAGPFEQIAWQSAIETLKTEGSLASPGFKRPEGIVIFHEAQGYLFKKTLEKDEAPKGKAE